MPQLDEEARAKLRAQDVGFVFQSFMLIPTLNALENVQLPALLRGESESASRENAVRLLTQLGLDKRLKHMPAQLSGGEQQRVAIAVPFQRARKFSLPMNRPAILIARPAKKLQIYSFPLTVTTAQH